MTLPDDIYSSDKELGSIGNSNDNQDLDYQYEDYLEKDEDSQLEDFDSSDSDYIVRRKHKKVSKKGTPNIIKKIQYKQPKIESSSDEEYFSSKSMRKAQKKISQKLKCARNSALKNYEESEEVSEESFEDYKDKMLDTIHNYTQETSEPTDSIDIVIKTRIGSIREKGSNSTIYAIRSNEPEDFSTKHEERELQYLIKWVGWSHIHNTWESEQSIKDQNLGGKKKFENFIKKRKDFDEWKLHSNAEEIEFSICQQQLNEELFEEYKFLERIVDHQTVSDNSVEYFCKWQSLPYAECSWEDGNLITRLFLDKIEEYKNRLSTTRRNDPVYANQIRIRSKPHFVPFKVQPDFIGNNNFDNSHGENPSLKSQILRDYQLDGVNWLLHCWVRNNSVILADEMGLGKTIQAICFISCLYHHFGVTGPFLFIVPLSTITSWQREFNIWSKILNVIVHLGDSKSRQILENHEWFYDINRSILKFNVILTTYEMILRDELLSTVTWAIMIVDEAHRLKNDESSLYKALFAYKSFTRILITGTPLQNSLKELWSLLHFIMPEKFNSWLSFELKFNKTECKDGYENLHNELEPFILRRIKKDVEKSLPPKVENILRVEMSQIQKRIYRMILTKNYRELSRGSKGNHANLLNIIVELKKCCNHASLIGDFNDLMTSNGNTLQDLVRGSGKLILLDKLLSRLKENGNRVLIFSQMVKMLDILSTYLKLRGFYFQRLDGTVTGDVRRQALDHFNAVNSQDFCFLLSTKAGGLGINLSTADTVIIFDSDWNPQNDLQAQARAHRIGQKNKVKIYRLVTKGSVEEDIIERAKRKMVLDHLVIQRMDTTGRKVLATEPSYSVNPQCTPFVKEELSVILKFGAIDLFRDNDNETDKKLQEMDIETILNMAETTDQTDQASSIGDELLNSFRVANFGAMEEVVDNFHWDQIIPESDRLKLIEEERKKHQSIMNLSMVPRRASAHKQSKMNLMGNYRNTKHVDDFDSSSVESIKKTTRTKVPNQKDFADFSKEDIKKFIRSYKKFPSAWKRPYAVANDCLLNEKQMDVCKKLAEFLHSLSIKLHNQQQHKQIGHSSKVSIKNKKNKSHKSPTIFKIAKVPINIDSLYQSELELQPIADMLDNAPSEDPSEWKKMSLPISIRSPSWTCQWSQKDDFMLVLGVYLHGINNWLNIKEDERLLLSKKILINGQTPLSKHLQHRIDIIMKAWKRFQSLSKPRKNNKKRHTAKSNSTKSSKNTYKKKKKDKRCRYDKKEIAEVESVDQIPINENDNSFGVAVNHSLNIDDASINQTKFHGNNENLKIKSSNDLLNVEHFELTDDLFQKCKETFRPIKDILKKLDNPEMIDGLINLCENKSQLFLSNQNLLDKKNHLNNIKNIVIDIGMYIDKCKDIEINHLWSFASQFTPLNAQSLSNLYFSFKNQSS